MKKIIVIIILCGIGYLGSKNINSDHNVLSIADGNERIIENGENKFVIEIFSDYNKELRIYGINDNDSSGWSPIAYADYIFVASPDIEDTENCEANSAADAPFINIIAANEDVRNSIRNLKKTVGRRRATIIGGKVYIKEFFFKGEDHSDALKKQGKMNPRSAIWIQEIIL